MRKISQAMDKSKFQAFGKVKFKVTPLYRKEIDGLYAKKIKILREENSDEKDKKVSDIDKNIAEHLIAQQRANLEKEITNLKEMKVKKGKAASVFNLKDKIIGSKKKQQEPAVIKDPNTKKIVTNIEEIKRISLKYCVDLLTNRKHKTKSS